MRIHSRDAENTIELTDPETVDGYLEDAALCVEQARLNDWYPNAHALIASLDLMAPEMNCNLYPSLTVHAAGGLPTYKEFVRVATDKAQAKEELPALARWKNAAGAEIYDVLARKYRYYSALDTVDEVLMESRKVFFRKIDKASATALFRIVLDRITVTGTLERLTVELGQQNSIWGRGAVTRDDMDAAQMSETLQGIVYRMAAQDVEMIFLRLGEDPAICVESVTKGTIGPFLSAHGRSEEQFSALQQAAGSGAVLNVSASTASSTQSKDILNDPFHLKPRFSPSARSDLEKQSIAAYHLLTDRKFVLRNVPSRAVESCLYDFGTQNLIYEVSYES